MTELLNKLIKVASAEVGYHEGTNNDNQYGIEYGWNNVAWCCIFAWWVCSKAGVDFPKCAHCNQVESYARNNGRWVTENYKVGDFVIFDYDLNGERDHIGVIIEDNGNKFTTIEGNYSDAVCRVSRKATDFIGAYRPDYGEEKTPIAEDDAEEFNDEDNIETPNSCVVELPVIKCGDIGEAVEVGQTLLKLHGFTPANSKLKNGRYDGEFGNGTLKALANFQAVNGIDDESGIFGVETWKKLIGGPG